MAFIYDESSNVTSFAETQDVIDKDKRIRDANECLSDATIETSLTRATERILAKLKMSTWWKGVNSSYTTGTLPDIDANLILGRQDDFTDLCVYTALSEYILPGVADFGDPEDADVAKISFYGVKASELFTELITLNDWYDTDNSGTVEDDEKTTTGYSLKRIR